MKYLLSFHLIGQSPVGLSNLLLRQAQPTSKFYSRCRNAHYDISVLFVQFKGLFLNAKKNVSVRIR